LPIGQLLVDFRSRCATSPAIGSARRDQLRQLLLINDGGNGFQTVNCAGGVAAGDVEVPVDGVTYTSGSLLEACALRQWRRSAASGQATGSWFADDVDQGLGRYTLDGNGNAPVATISSELLDRPPVNNLQWRTAGSHHSRGHPKGDHPDGSEPGRGSVDLSIVEPPQRGPERHAPSVTYTLLRTTTGPDSFTSGERWYGDEHSGDGDDHGDDGNDPRSPNRSRLSTPERHARAITLTRSDIDFDPLTYSHRDGTAAHGSSAGRRRTSPTPGGELQRAGQLSPSEPGTVPLR